MQKLWYYLYGFLLKRLIQFYISRDTTLRHEGLKLIIRKGVFHPRFFFSSRFMFSFLKTVDLKNKSLLELGSGSGFLSLLAFKKGAKVLAVDIDPLAVENTRTNFQLNFGTKEGFAVQQSDLFENIYTQTFDVIIVNPPYYFKPAQRQEQLAWNCGPNGEYFEKLFASLRHFVKPDSQVYMVLSDACELTRIRQIAESHSIKFELVHSKKIMWEENYIYSLYL